MRIYDGRSEIFGPRIVGVDGARGGWLQYSAKMHEHQKRKIFGDYLIAQRAVDEAVPISCGVVEPSENVTLSDRESMIRCMTPAIVVRGNENKAFLEGALVPVSKTLQIQMIAEAGVVRKLIVLEWPHVTVFDLARY